MLSKVTRWSFGIALALQFLACAGTYVVMQDKIGENTVIAEELYRRTKPGDPARAELQEPESIIRYMIEGGNEDWFEHQKNAVVDVSDKRQ